MKTVIVGINSKYIHSSLAVLSLKSYCDAYADDGNIGEVIAQEFTINDQYDSILYGIMSCKPDVVAISCYIWNINIVSRLIKDLKKIKNDFIIIIGGPEVSYGIDHTEIDKSDVDYIVQGEGEVAFYNLLKNINSESHNAGNSDHDFIVNEQLITNPDDAPSPYNDEYFSNNPNKILYYESSRGCPFSCAYCLSSRCSAGASAVRYLSLDRVYSDIDMFIYHGVNQVKFVDRTFNANIKRAKNIINYVIDKANDKNINFHFEIGGDLFDDEFLELLTKAKPGLIQFEIGIQSTNEETLRESARVMPLDEIFHNVNEIMKMKNINIHLDLIVGLPFENFEIFKRSFNDVYSLRPHQLQVGFLKLLRGSPFEQLIDKHEYVFSSHPPYEVLSNKYITNSEIIFLKRFEDCFDKFYNSGRFVTALDYLLQFYNDSFSMYEALTKYIEEKELAFMSIASRRLYDLIVDFAIEKVPTIDVQWFREQLLYDFYSSDKSDTIPESLRSVTDFSKSTKTQMKEFLKNNSQYPASDYLARCINGKCYVFKYSLKHPVTELYEATYVFDF